MRASYEYWYPVDFRNSGKDLVQNHLSFMLFTHVALLPENKWPRAYGVNGHVTVDGNKMSKSLGNVIPVRVMLDEYGADASRLTILNGGEGMDDPNWDSELAKTTSLRQDQFLALCKEHAHDDAHERHEELPVDKWLESVVHRTIRDASRAMEETNYRTAMQLAWFELTNTIKRYKKLCNGNVHAAHMRFALETQTKIIQPIMPHLAHEAWNILGHKELLAFEPWPAFDNGLIDEALEATQDLIEQLASDIRSVQTLLKKETLHGVTIIVAREWLYPFTQALRDELRETRDVGALMKRFTTSYNEHAKDVTKLVPLLVRDPSKLPRTNATQEREFTAVHAAADYLGKQFGAPITVQRAEESSEQKANAAMPSRPAILLS
jgi:leucyl-tRNA synthetase